MVAALFAFAARVVGSERRADAVLLLLVAVVLDVFIASLCGVCALLVHARGQRTPQWGCVLGCLPFVRYVWLCFALTTVSVASEATAGFQLALKWYSGGRPGNKGDQHKTWPFP